MQKLNIIPDLDLSIVPFKESRSTLLNYILYYRGGYNVKGIPARKSIAVHKKPEVPVSERYTLSVEEAAIYYGIGQKRLRSLIAENPNADYLLAVGNRTQFKRKLFEEYIDNATCI